MLATFEDLTNIRQQFSSNKIVMALGCFDLLHPGHGRALSYAKSLGDLLVVGAWSDEFVNQNKGPTRPINPVKQRVEMLDYLRCVDISFAIPGAYTERTSGVTAVLNRLEPDFYVLGGEKSIAAGTFNTALGRQIYVVQDPTYAEKSYSTTAMLTKS